MPTYPEKDLFPPDRPKKRDTTKDPLPKFQLTGRVNDHIVAYYIERFKERYHFAPGKIRNPVTFHKVVQSRLNEVAQNFFKDHFVTWARLPDYVNPQDAESVVEHRFRLAKDFIDFLFKERKTFGDVSWGDVVSSHWWTAYQQRLTKVQAMQQATGWDEDTTRETAKERETRRALLDSWND